MKGSLVIILCFSTGVLLAVQGYIPTFLIESNFTLYALYILMFLVGISIGSDEKALNTLRKPSFKLILVPIGTIIGTLVGSACVAPFLSERSLTDCLAVGSGFGYYSLSSVFITQYKGAELGTIALSSNIIRELFALLTAPLLVTYLGKLAPISAGGATTMDTTLPIISRFSGKEFVAIAIFHGFVVDLSVPFLVTLFCSI